MEKPGGVWRPQSVIHYYDIDSGAVKAWCEDKGWPCHSYNDIYGCEWPACVVLNIITPETISRAANLLVLVTTDRFVSVWVSG